MEQAVRKEREVEQARDFIKTRKVGLVAHITIDHPPTNSVSTGILQQIADLVSDYEADDGVRAILLDSANGKPVFAADATAGTFDYQPGDVGFVPRNMGHYIENTGTTKLQFLELWRTGKFADVSLRQWLAFTPYELVQANVKIDRSVLAKVPTEKTPVVPG